jgi:hypothetical protein
MYQTAQAGRAIQVSRTTLGATRQVLYVRLSGFDLHDGPSLGNSFIHNFYTDRRGIDIVQAVKKAVPATLNK